MLHDRVRQLSALRLSQLKAEVDILQKPTGKSFFVTVDEFWLDVMLKGFSVCEDWAVLFKCAL